MIIWYFVPDGASFIMTLGSRASSNKNLFICIYFGLLVGRHISVVVVVVVVATSMGKLERCRRTSSVFATSQFIWQRCFSVSQFMRNKAHQNKKHPASDT